MADVTWLASTTGKTSAGTLDGDEEFRVVDDPAGTAVTKKTTPADVAAYANTQAAAQIAALSDAGTLDGDELIRVIDDPDGTPAAKTTTPEALADYIGAGAYAYASELEGEDGTLIDFVGKRVVTFSNETPAKNEITPMATFLTTTTRASDGTYVDKDGILQTATTNELRYTHDPFTGQPLGVLRSNDVENILVYSEELDQWVASNSTVTTNATTAPDGSTTADKIVTAVTTSSNHQVQRAFSASAAAAHSFSVFLKAAEKTFAAVQIGNGFGDVYKVYIDLTTGDTNVPGGVTPDGIKSERWLNGWWRLSFHGVAQASPTAANFLIMVADSLGATIMDGDGTSGIYAWGAMVGDSETGASSYVPTGASTVSRAADIIEGDISKLDQQGGPVSIAVIGRYNSATTSANQYIFGMDDNVTTDSFLIYRVAAGGLRAISYSGADLSPSLNLGTMTDASPDLVLVVTFQENSMRGKSSLGVADAETGDPLPVGDMTRMQFGRGGAGANCTIERVVISNRGWSDTKIARIAASRD